jgi:hypothetical protein
VALAPESEQAGYDLDVAADELGERLEREVRGYYVAG